MTANPQLRRLPDWQTRLESFFRDREARAFAWGVNDCCLFAADAVLSMTGHDLASDVREKVPGTRQALRYARDHGGVVGLVREALGEPLAPGFARVGDVVVVRMGKRQAAGICNGSTVIGPGKVGVLAVPMTQALHCWRVG